MAALFLLLLASSSSSGRVVNAPLSPRELLTRNLASIGALTAGSILLPSAALAKVRGYQAAQSAFAPSLCTSAVPRLAQSVLINTLPIQNELVGELQNYLESFTQLVDPSNAQISQIATTNSVLWNNLRINAQRAAGMFLYNREDLLPEIAAADSFAEASKRRIYGEIYLTALKDSVLRLVTASRQSDVTECIRLMKQALTNLANVAYLLVPEDALLLAANASTPDIAAEYSNLPRLIGRATVALTFQRPGPLSILKDDRRDEARLLVIADGINFPYTAGNFLSLCMNHFYENTRVEVDNYETNGQSVPRLVLGSYDAGFVEPFTGQQRTVPLEVLRGGKNRPRHTVTGNAYNSLVFTRDAPVKSFATEGTLGMYHARGDGNGGSSAFFWVPTDRNLSPAERSSMPALARLNTRFAAFAHVVEGAELLSKLRPSDVLLSAEIQEGAWELVNDHAGLEALPG